MKKHGRPSGIVRATMTIAARDLRGATRRKEHFLWRTLYVALLFGLLVMVVAPHAQANPEALPRMGRRVFTAFTIAQIAFFLLVGPGMAATAICREKQKKTLGLLLLTPLPLGAVALGKWIGTTVWCWFLVASGLPVLAVVALYGGVSYGEILRVFALTLCVILVATSVGTWAGGRQWSAGSAVPLAWFVLLTGYVILPFLWMAAIWDPGLSGSTGNPVALDGDLGHDILLVLNPLVRVRQILLGEEAGASGLLARQGTLVAGSASLALLTALLFYWAAVRTLRKRALRESSGGLRSFFRRVDRLMERINVGGIVLVRDRPLPLRGNPVAWLEGKTRGMLRFRNLFRISVALLVVETIPLCAAVITSEREEGLSLQAVLAAIGVVPLLIVWLGAGAVSREREQGTWESLLATPLTGTEILTGKLIAILRGVLPVLALLGIVGAWSLAGDLVRTFLKGQYDPWRSVEVLLYSLAGIASLAILGLAFSLVSSSPARAVAMTLGAAAVLYILPPIVAGSVGSRYPAGGGVPYWIADCALALASAGSLLLLVRGRGKKPGWSLIGILGIFLVTAPALAGLLVRVCGGAGIESESRVLGQGGVPMLLLAAQMGFCIALFAFLRRNFDRLAGRVA